MSWEKLGQFLIKIHFVRIAIAFLVLNGIVFALLVFPSRARHSALEMQLKDLQGQVVAADRRTQESQHRFAALEQAQKDLEFLYAKVFESEKTGPAEIRLWLEDLAQRTQVRRGDFTYDYNDLSEYQLRQFVIGVPVEGSYRNIRQLINSIERSKHFLILERVDLSAEKQKPDTVNLNFRLSTYLVNHAS